MKKYIVMTAVLLICFSMASCGNTSNEETTTTAPVTPTVTTADELPETPEEETNVINLKQLLNGRENVWNA